MTKQDRDKLRRSASAEDFALAFKDVELHLNGPDDVMPLSPRAPEEGGHSDYHEELADFSEYWANSANNSGLPPKDPGAQARWSKQQQQQQQYHGQQGAGHPQQQQHPSFPTQQQQQNHRSMMSGATSPTEAATDTGTQASESWAGTTAADDVVSCLSNDTDGCDTASRSSVKRRRMTATSSGASSHLGFQPLEQVSESGIDAAIAGGGATASSGENVEPDVRPWKVDIPDHDVVLGDTHEPTWGTKIYREVRKPYAKKTITNEQLKTVKLEFQRRLEKELGKSLSAPPRFWCNKESKAKTKQIPVSGFLKNRPGITYAYAKDQAIREDIKNASARPRTRQAKHFTFKGPLNEAIEKALEICQNWVGDDIGKELYAKGFREDVERLAPWRGEYIKKKQACEQKASCETVMRGTHMREARIHEAHANHLEIAMVDMINQLGNMMIEAHRADHKRPSKSSSSNMAAAADGLSIDSSTAGGGSRNSKARSSGRGSVSASAVTKPTPSYARANSAPIAQGTLPPMSKGATVAASRKDGVEKTKKEAAASSSAFRSASSKNDIQDMDVSPIEMRKSLSEHLAATSGPPAGDHARGFNAGSRRDLSSMFSQTLRMGSLEDIGGGGGNNASQTNGNNVAVVMPPGLPREVRPGGCTADELSVLSAPDDLSVMFTEAREAAIRRGIDHPGALPQPGQVADRTKALLQQMKNRSDQAKK